MRRCQALTLLTTRGLWQQQPALPARFPVGAGIRQLAHENFLASISEIDNKDLRLKGLTALLKEREQSQNRVDKEREKSDNYAKEVIESLRCDVLRAKGLMTARGVFERVAQLVFNEQRCKGKFTTGVLQALANPSAGERSQFLFDIFVTDEAIVLLYVNSISKL